MCNRKEGDMNFLAADCITNETDFFVEYDKCKTEELKLKYISSYIIAKLKKQALSAMIGAGFSLNANRNYPDWASLLLDAFNEMHPNTPKRKKFERKDAYKKRQAQYIRNIGEPKVAEEYEKFKGNRESLDLYIEKQLLKINSANNNLSTHKALLDLNWSDIITTNWDSLLEDSRKNTEYSLVTEAKGLKVSNNKRIIKINGSLRTSEQIKNNDNYSYDGCFDHLYIITSQDFENYSTKHEDFSNFMKVKILENTFCLFGFSGNDCNFKYWVKELKRLMTKGGNTKNPNPIFLFSLEDNKQIDNALSQFYKNNYIIPINIYKLYSVLYGIDYENIKVLSPSYIFLKLFDYFYHESNNNKDKQYKSFETSKNIDSENLFNNLQNANNNSINNEFLKLFNSLDIFLYSNLFYTSSCIDKIQALYSDLDNWTENTFIFLHHWLLWNYYSLSNLYEEEKINKIIEVYLTKNFQNTDAYVFCELIFKYYREAQLYNEFESLCSKLQSNTKLNNIILYSKANRLVDELKYEELKELLKKWTPENDKNPDSLYIIRKASLMKTFESFIDTKDERQYIEQMFTKALDACNESQYKYFIAIYQKQFYQNQHYEINYFNQSLIDSLLENGAKEIFKYIDEFKKDHIENDYKSNISKRYTITKTFSTTSGNENLINAIRIFNFFEYTGLPMSLFFHNEKMIKLIPSIKKTDYYLIKSLIQNISYFGHDSEEDYMRNVLNKTLRFVSKDKIVSLFISCLHIFKFKLENKKDIRSYLFLVSELTEYVSESNDFFDYFYSLIHNQNTINQSVLNLICRGKVWGAERPFLKLIDKITDSEKFKVILDFVINEYIKDERDLIKQEHYSPSAFYSYYFELMQKNKFENTIREVFSTDKIKKVLEEDFGYEKQLCLYGYEYLPEDIKQKTKEYFENNYSFYTDPYFIKYFKSENLKKHILQNLKQYDIMSFNSRDYPFSNYIRMLYHEKMLTENDKKEVCSILSNYYDQIQKDKEYFKYGFRSLKDTLASLYYCLEDVLTEEEKINIPQIKTAYEKIKNEFILQIQSFYDFKWLYVEDLQKFRLAFSEALSYFSYLHQANQYLYIVNIALTKIIVQNDANFEAVLELFINAYINGYENNVFVNSETHELLLQVMKKFKLEIPYCYDFLFIQNQMKLLAKALKDNNIQNDVINYWLEN